MKFTFLKALVAFPSLVAVVSAQTFSKCNPMKQSKPFHKTLSLLVTSSLTLPKHVQRTLLLAGTTSTPTEEQHPTSLPITALK